MPILYKRLEETDNGDVADGLAEVFIRRQDMESTPVLLKAALKEFKSGDKLAGVSMALALADMGNQALPEVVKLWNERKELFVRKRLLLAAAEMGTAESRKALEAWKADLTTALGQIKDTAGGKSGEAYSQALLLERINFFLNDLKEAVPGELTLQKDFFDERSRALGHKGRLAKPVIKELTTKAAEAQDPLLVWHEAAKVNNPYVKNEAIRQMEVRLDPRSLSILDGLSKESAETPPPEFRDLGVCHYPSFAARVAQELRAKIAFDEQLAKSELGKRAQVAVKAFKNDDVHTQRFAIDWLLKQPPSEEVIDGLLLWPKNSNVGDYLGSMEKKFMPIVYKRLEETDDGDVAYRLADVLRKRHERDGVSALLKAIFKDFKTGEKLAGVSIAMALGSFGNQPLPEIDRIWGENQDFFVRKRLAIAANVAGSQESRALLEQWQAGLKTELQTMQNANDTESTQFKTKRDMVKEIRLFLQNFKEKEDQP